MPDPANPPRPTGITLLALIWIWNGAGAVAFGLVGLAPSAALRDMLWVFYPVPSWMAAAARVGPQVNLGVWVGLGIAQLTVGLGLWKLRNWARWAAIVQLAFFLIVPNLGAIVFGARYYPTYASLWGRLLFNGAFALLGVFLVKYLLSHAVTRSFPAPAREAA